VPRVIHVRDLRKVVEAKETADFDADWYFSWCDPQTSGLPKELERIFGPNLSAQFPAGMINGPFGQLYESPEVPVFFVVPAFDTFLEIRHARLKNSKKIRGFSDKWNDHDNLPVYPGGQVKEESREVAKVLAAMEAAEALAVGPEKQKAKLRARARAKGKMARQTNTPVNVAQMGLEKYYPSFSKAGTGAGKKASATTSARAFKGKNNGGPSQAAVAGKQGDQEPSNPLHRVIYGKEGQRFVVPRRTANLKDLMQDLNKGVFD